MAKQIQIRVNTSNNAAEDYNGQRYVANENQQIGKLITIVNGDVITLVCDFNEETLDGLIQDMDLSGALALRAILSSSRAQPQVVFSFQDTYNSGIVPSNEDLSQGLVTWNVFADPVNIDPFLGGEESVLGWLEIAWVDANGLPQTLVQLPVQFFEQIDENLGGTPPPSSPTFLTAAEVAANYVELADYIVPSELAVDSSPTPVSGIQTFFVNPGGGTLTITLPALAATPDKFVGRFVNIGSGTMRLFPNALETINGQTGLADFPTQYTEVILMKRNASEWVNPMLVTV
jgi:hypothetical protein